jgi:hypothetical protein
MCGVMGREGDHQRLFQAILQLPGTLVAVRAKQEYKLSKQMPSISLQGPSWQFLPLPFKTPLGLLIDTHIQKQ